MTGGQRVARVLAQRGVRELFTLCGGHVSPILVEAERAGIAIIDVRDEAHAVFAADARARLGGVGVAVVTAGPGVTNSLTALRNASMARSPLVLIGGATATALVGRGALQDIDQAAAVRPHVKKILRPRRVRDLAPAVERSFSIAAADVPGPVFVETAVDLLYPQELVQRWYLGEAERAPRSLAGRALRWHLRRHLARLFAPGGLPQESTLPDAEPPPPPAGIEKAARALSKAQRPVILVGSPALRHTRRTGDLAQALRGLGAPTFLSGGARGLLGPPSPPVFRHRRREALREADLVVLSGVPCDFRLGYGRTIAGRARVVAMDLDRKTRRLNRRPGLEVRADAGEALIALSHACRPEQGRWARWIETLTRREDAREAEIDKGAASEGDALGPLTLLRTLDGLLDEASIVVGDGGDFIGTAAYTLAPRAPLSWLDPGPFGTLGCGGGFALAAKRARPDSDVWLLLGDGSSAFSLAELDTMARHDLGVIAIIGNDAAWSQIARDQVRLLGATTGTSLASCDYERVAEGFGARGLVIDHPAHVLERLEEARTIARGGTPVLINARICPSAFREGSISI